MPKRPSIVEFIGCSGSGKTTLCRATYEQLRIAGVRVSTSLSTSLGDSWTASPIHSQAAGNLLTEATGLFDFAWRMRHSAYWKTTSLLVRENAISYRERLRLYRSVLRKHVNHDASLNSACGTNYVLIDEGMLHLAHVLVGRASTECQPEQLRSLARVLPRPDIVVWVKATASVVQNRLELRGSPPVPDRGSKQRNAFLDSAEAVFSGLFELLNPPPHVIHVDNCRNSREAVRRLAESIAKQILSPNQRENSGDRSIFAEKNNASGVGTVTGVNADQTADRAA